MPLLVLFCCLVGLTGRGVHAWQLGWDNPLWVSQKWARWASLSNAAHVRLWHKQVVQSSQSLALLVSQKVLHCSVNKQTDGTEVMGVNVWNVAECLTPHFKPRGIRWQAQYKPVQSNGHVDEGTTQLFLQEQCSICKWGWMSEILGEADGSKYTEAKLYCSKCGQHISNTQHHIRSIINIDERVQYYLKPDKHNQSNFNKCWIISQHFKVRVVYSVSH